MMMLMMLLLMMKWFFTVVVVIVVEGKEGFCDNIAFTLLASTVTTCYVTDLIHSSLKINYDALSIIIITTTTTTTTTTGVVLFANTCTIADEMN